MKKINEYIKTLLLPFSVFLVMQLSAQNYSSKTYDSQGNIMPEYKKEIVVSNKKIKIEAQNYPLYLGVENRVKITYPSGDQKSLGVMVKSGNLKKISESDRETILGITPINTDFVGLMLKFKDSTIQIRLDVSNLPFPLIFFDKKNPNALFRNQLTRDSNSLKDKPEKLTLLSDIWSHTELKAECLGMPCRIKSFKINVLYPNDVLVEIANRSDYDSELSKQQKLAILKLANGSKFYIEDAIVELPDGLTRKVSSTFKIFENELYANIFNDKINTYTNNIPIRRINTDLRVKFEANISKEVKKELQTVFDEINSCTNDVDVKMVESFPGITFYYDEKETYKKYNIDSCNWFFPNVLAKERINIAHLYYSNTHKANDVDVVNTLDVILNYLGVVINNRYYHDKTGYHLTPLCKEYLETLYSKGGEAKIYKELNIERPYEKDNTLIIVVISLVIFIFMKELIALIFKGKSEIFCRNKFCNHLIYCILIAQIPLLFVLIMQLLDGIKLSLHLILNAEAYYTSFALTVGIMLWGLDQLQKQLKYSVLNFYIDIIFCFFIFFSAYQIIFLVTHGQWVWFNLVNAQWIYVPFVVAFYRIYSMYSQKKLNQLLQEKEFEISKQKELTTKAELLALQSRINPHFLYNSLNSIASLAPVDADKTEQMAINLSKLFRYNLNKGNELMTTIKQELEMVKVYLDIEKQRFGDRLNYQVDVPEDLLEFQIPNFLIQPLVENAIKHGISKITEKGIIKIKIEHKDKSLIINIYDNGPQFTDEIITGYGLQNVSDKLSLVYHEKFSIRFVNEGEKRLEIRIEEQ